MNKLEKLHLEAITKAEYDLEGKAPNYIGFASKSAETTEEIVIEFAEWRDNRLKKLNKWILSSVPVGNRSTTKELFQEFLETKL